MAASDVGAGHPRLWAIAIMCRGVPRPKANRENTLARHIALIGCGAIAQLIYLPALAKLRKKFTQVWLVDPNQKALAAGLAMIPSARTARTLQEVTDRLSFAIVATPNSIHFDLARDCLLRGAHVLIEKPFVVLPEEGVKLLEIAAAQDRIVAVNQTRRFFPSVKELKERIESGEFGKFKAATHFEGAKLAWPFESGAAFAPDAFRTGVIMDFGVHVIDFYNYLLTPTWGFVSATHDGIGGPEGLAELRLTANGAPLYIRLSRYVQQKNQAQLSFERADVSAGVYELYAYTVRTQGGASRTYRVKPSGVSYYELPIVHNFISATDKEESPRCDGASSLPVIRVLDQVYREATVYPAQIGFV